MIICYIKNPNILADKIVKIYKANPNAKALKPNNKENNVKLQKVVNKINGDKNIGKRYKEFVRESRNIPGNTNILYDYETYKNLVLDRINNEEVSTSNDNSSIKEVSTSNDNISIKEISTSNDNSSIKEVSTSNNNSSIKEVSTSNDDSFIEEVGKKY